VERRGGELRAHPGKNQGNDTPRGSYKRGARVFVWGYRRGGRGGERGGGL